MIICIRFSWAQICDESNEDKKQELCKSEEMEHRNNIWTCMAVNNFAMRSPFTLLLPKAFWHQTCVIGYENEI